MLPDGHVRYKSIYMYIQDSYLHIDGTIYL